MRSLRFGPPALARFFTPHLRALHDLAIQQSLLPAPPFRFLPDVDIHGRSDSAAIVGGDVFDVQSLTPDSASALLADASGHGLPAALQARDVVIGLRMAHENHLKIVATIEKLNRVLCNSTLSSQFVSLATSARSTSASFSPESPWQRFSRGKRTRHSA